ncbi:MAG: replicative DNA helicase [Clostridiales bacterium]|nr:replicative DNA helicase [Clostridiales bacterium]
MADYKIMPHNIEAEQAVLGCILIDLQAQTDILALMKEDDFYSSSHKQIYSTMCAIYQKSTPVDFITLTDKLDQDKILDKVGGIEYITTLTNVVPSAANFTYYCNIVKADSIRRKLIFSGQRIIENAYESEDKEQSIQFAEKEVFDVAEKQGASALEQVGVQNGAVSRVIAKFDQIAKDPTSLKGIPTGYRDFDKITNGLQNSDLILLAARPGVGKTSFSMNMVVNAAVEQGKNCAIFSLEMGRDQLMQRAICSLAKVSMAKALNGTMDAEEWKRIWQATKKLESSGLYVDDSAMTTPADVLAKCRRLKTSKGLDLVMIDYLQLMNSGSNKKDQNRQNEVTDISRNLKIAAKELNVPIIALSQLSRDVEKSSRPDHRPVLSDLRDSGAIEQDADIVLFLYNPEKYNDVPQEDEPGTVELIIAKHRNGSTGTVKLRWIGEYTTFVNLGEKTFIPKREHIEADKIEETPIDNFDDDVFDD